MSDSSSDDDSGDDIFSDTPGTARGTHDPIPEKSKKGYMKAYDDFMKWRKSKDYTSFEENVMLEYFIEKSENLKPTSLNTFYSMLKSTLMLNHEVDMSVYSNLLGFLKNKTVGHEAKKAKTFTADEVNKFIKEARDHEHLLTKVGLIFGIAGACRRQELYKLQYKDVEVLGSKILVKVKSRKTNAERVFTISGDYYKVCKKYINLRPEQCCCISFFVQYKSGKCYPQTVGINKFGKLGKTIAKFLKLPNPELYTGHCFRRTSATILADGEAEILSVNDSKEAFENKSIQNYAIATVQEVPIECQRSTRNKNIEYVSIDIPNNIRTNTDDTIDSKDGIWDQIKMSFSSGNNDIGNSNSPGTSMLEDGGMDDSMDSEDLMVNQNPFVEGKTDRVVNINIPGSASSLQQALSTIVRFNNCSIQNLNINYSK